ncbi:hypothetical protein BDW71DRAFT_211967 [Aspergillus fruticulosus]
MTNCVHQSLFRPRISALLPRIPTLRRYTPHAATQEVAVQGPHVGRKSAPEHREALLAQLRDIPKDTRKLRIEEDTPSDTEWSILAEHFTSVRDLELESGFNEELNDRNMPVHWPLERLLVSGVCGEVTKSPHILRGRIQHLILYLTSEMRFEGPTSAELRRMNQEAIERGEAKVQYLSETSKIQLINITQLGRKWMEKKYNPPGLTENPPLEPENQPVDGEDSRLRTLEIIEDDALDTFLRMAASHALAELVALESLNLSVGVVFSEPSTLPGLYTGFPPNLTTLHFRGPITLCRSERWEEWVSAFRDRNFLPNLSRLAFVLDLHYVPDKHGTLRPDAPPEEDLREARAACERLYEGARRRGISIESFHDEWAVTVSDPILVNVKALVFQRDGPDFAMRRNPNDVPGSNVEPGYVIPPSLLRGLEVVKERPSCPVVLLPDLSTSSAATRAEKLPLPSSFLISMHFRFATVLHMFHIEDKVPRGWPSRLQSRRSSCPALFRIWRILPVRVRVICCMLLNRAGRKLYPLEADDWAQRLPNPNPKNEPNVLELVQKHTSILAPRLLDTWESDGITNVLMTRVPGRLRRSTAQPYLMCDSLSGPIIDRRIPDEKWDPLYTEAGFNDRLTSHLDVLFSGIVKNTSLLARDHGHSYFTHSDFHPTNLLDERSRLSGIVDWESAGFRLEYWEFTKAVYEIYANAVLRDIFWRAVWRQYETKLEVERRL